ncbi:MAG: hypothetical protein LBD23_12375 [Oscillospiraceae bacterium]|jgi:hypothetical protein|nr:hypothetical protein [Oscillospiraceae bacterium]
MINFCSECGQESLSNINFCGKCGTAVLLPQQHAEQNQSEFVNLNVQREILNNLAHLRARIMPYQNTFSVGGHHEAIVETDGRVVSTGFWYNEVKCDTSKWRNIIAISSGDCHTLGLKANGKVVAGGYRFNEGETGKYKIAKTVFRWRKIIAISIGWRSDYAWNENFAGLKSDGTVVYADIGRYGVLDWKDIIAISNGGNHIAGLRRDGTVVTNTTHKTQTWNNIVAVSAGYDFTIGLKADGTVVAANNKNTWQYDIKKWNNIIALYVSRSIVVGLKSDGSAVEDGGFGSSERWKNIIVVSTGTPSRGMMIDGSIVDDNKRVVYQRGVKDLKQRELEAKKQAADEQQRAQIEYQKETARLDELRRKASTGDRSSIEELQSRTMSMSDHERTSGGYSSKSCPKCGDALFSISTKYHGLDYSCSNSYCKWKTWQSV